MNLEINTLRGRVFENKMEEDDEEPPWKQDQSAAAVGERCTVVTT